MIDSVPLIQNANDAQQINASIIAMKKASRELDEKIVKLNSLNSELDKKIAILNSGLNKEIEDRKEAIKSLDVSSVGGSGKYISAISETDGKISAIVSNLTSVIESGNSQPVTSGGVYNAIDKINYSASARNIDTLYPSENGKSEVFGGNFSGNVPEPTQTAILKTFRISSSYSSEVQMYQEWEAYGSSASGYSPNKYFRFGYFTGSDSPTWSSWQRFVRDTDVGNLKFFYKNYGQVSISAGVTLYDLPTELSGKNIIMAFGAIGSYLMPRPHLNNAGQYAQSWGLGVSLTGGKLNILTPDSWSGILQVVFIYN